MPTGQKRGGPAEADQEERDDGRSQDGAHGRAAVEEAASEGALAFRKPLGHHFDGGGPVAGFAHAQQEPEDAEAPGAAREGVKHGRRRPPKHAQRVAQARAEAVDDRPGGAVHDGVGQHESEDHARILHVAHVELFAQNGRGDRKGLAVEVVDDGRPEGQRDHEPAARRWFHARSDHELQPAGAASATIILMRRSITQAGESSAGPPMAEPRVLHAGCGRDPRRRRWKPRGHTARPRAARGGPRRFPAA